MTRAGGDRAGGATDGNVVSRLTLDVLPRPQDVAAARHAVARFLTDHGVSSVVIDDVELVTSELVTNAVVHPEISAPIHVEVEVGEGVVLAVSNVGSAAPIPDTADWRPAPPFALSGRGLGIVRRLSDAVAVTEADGRAVVTWTRRLPDGGPR
jgi:anti-sigma regulatory factor (Ser/Thr protein kinase)